MGVTALAVLESLFMPKVFPRLSTWALGGHGYDGSSPSRMALLMSALFINYSFLILYHAVVYPTFISPLRLLPAPKVRSRIAAPANAKCLPLTKSLCYRIISPI